MSNGTTGRNRCVALVGPYLSGKTSLLESILYVTGAIPRKGMVKDGNTVGDASPEARARKMSVEITPAETSWLGDRWTFLDCPGSIEFAQDAMNACMIADIAVVVCEPDPARAVVLGPLLRFLDMQNIPHMLFVNKMDASTDRVREILAALQGVSQRPLVLRQIPIPEGEAVGGYVDLISERAYRYKPGEPSDLVSIPENVLDAEQAARQEMLEALADHDDRLLEQLLEDAVPPKEEIYRYLRDELKNDLIVPVLIGAGERDHGVRRLLKALRHDAPDVAVTAERLGLDGGEEPLVQVFKTYHAQHTGKLSLSRVWRGTLKEGATLGGERIGNLAKLSGAQTAKVQAAEAGEVVAIGRVEGFRTGDLLSPGGVSRPDFWPEPMPPVYALAIHAENRNDEVKLTGAVQKLIEEDASYAVEQNPEMHELLLWGQGEQHLQIGVSRLQSKYNVTVRTSRPRTPYRETIRKSTTQHSRHKRQTGGHGQFADVVVEIQPLPRGSGFAFSDRIVGGAVPKNYIPAVEAGIREYLQRGPLGFPVVDVAATLTDGKYHAVDSSDMAFKTAGRLAMSEGMPNCDPILLEPILKVSVYVPSEFTPNVQRLLSGRRGQILGFDARDGWPGWDEVQAYIPQSEMHDMIIELRSLTMGVGSFAWQFDHLQELTGRLADDVVRARAEAAQ